MKVRINLGSALIPTLILISVISQVSVTAVSATLELITLQFVKIRFPFLLQIGVSDDRFLLSLLLAKIFLKELEY